MGMPTGWTARHADLQVRELLYHEARELALERCDLPAQRDARLAIGDRWSPAGGIRRSDPANVCTGVAYQALRCADGWLLSFRGA